MLRLTEYDDCEHEPDSLPFPTEAVRLLTAARDALHEEDSIARAERALQRVESDFMRLRAEVFNDDDRPRAA